MRDRIKLQQIEVAKRKSKRGHEQLILESLEKREYFRLQNNKIIEYDLTKCNSKQIKLRDEEKQGIAQFDFSDNKL